MPYDEFTCIASLTPFPSIQVNWLPVFFSHLPGPNKYSSVMQDIFSSLQVSQSTSPQSSPTLPISIDFPPVHQSREIEYSFHLPTPPSFRTGLDFQPSHSGASLRNIAPHNSNSTLPVHNSTIPPTLDAVLAPSLAAMSVPDIPESSPTTILSKLLPHPTFLS